MLRYVMPRYVLFHKPYGVLSQFTSEDGAPGLSGFGLPKDIYAAGRLDKDSEGLLLLTDDGPLIDLLLNPKFDKQKTYWALVEREPTEEELERFRSGLQIEDYKTKPAHVKILDPQPEVTPREPPVRLRKSVQDFWIEVKITEGKNRQVRKMTAAIGHPTLRLIRKRLGELELGDLQPGQWKEITRPSV
jgi:23S rRNA pseudouridine2457 synthase